MNKTILNNVNKTEEKARVLGFNVARELTVKEMEIVAGGAIDNSSYNNGLDHLNDDEA